jgi:phenylpyruvate tautomerase
MPLVRVVSNQPPLDPESTRVMLSELSKSVSRLLGKPERWVMTCLEPSASMTFAGTTDPTCYAEVKSIGVMTPNLTRQISAELCGLLSKHLKVAPSRTYIEFADAVGHLWGNDGATFG